MFKRITSILFLTIAILLAESNFVYAAEANNVPEVCEEISNTKKMQSNATVKSKFEILTSSGSTTNFEDVENDEMLKHSSDITFSGEYISDGNVMPYALYTPSTAKLEAKSKLIVWLHGLGEINVSSKDFLNGGLPAIMNNWKMDGFNAYIICPHLADKWNTGNWCSDIAKNNLQKLLDQFILEHNIDTDNIIIVGHSLGGKGAMYMAHEFHNYFSKCVVLSGYYPEIDSNEITIPTIGYVGKNYAGEDGNSIYYMENSFAPTFGSQNLFYLEASHGEVPKVAFSMDENNNNRSDLVEWMLDELELCDTQNY